MLRGCGGVGMPGAGATELSPQLTQDNSIKYTNKATKLSRFQHQSTVEYLKYNISSKLPTALQSIRGKKEVREPLASLSKALNIHCH